MQKVIYLTREELENERINMDNFANGNFTGYDNAIALVAGMLAPLLGLTYGYVKSVCEVRSQRMKKEIQQMARNGYGVLRVTTTYEVSGSDYGTWDPGAISGYQTAKITNVEYTYLTSLD